MTLPKFWRGASFTVADAAELIGVTTVTLRTWLARAPAPDFLGAKMAGRLYLSAMDCFHYALVRELTAYGVPVRAAMLEAGTLANQCGENLPNAEYMTVRTRAGNSEFHLTNMSPDDGDPVLILPIRAIAVQLIDKAAQMHGVAR